MELIEQLKWRYSAKRMNGKSVPGDKIRFILDAIALAPSSMGLQPFQIMVIEDPKVRQEIYEKASRQPQILECSHLLVFCGWTSVQPQQIDEYITTISNTRNIPPIKLEDFKNSLLKFATSMTTDEIKEWTARQSYLALGTAIDAAALSHVDATPMEGFSASALDKLLGLPDRHMHSCVLLALGYRDVQKDEFAAAPKVRRQFEELFEMI